MKARKFWPPRPRAAPPSPYRKLTRAQLETRLAQAEEKITRLELANARLQKDSDTLGWIQNPDRMGR